MLQDSEIPVLGVHGLRVGYRAGVGAERPYAVDGVDLEVRRGEILALVGESGSGKTTAALAVTGLLPAAARVAAGRILFRGRDLTLLDDAALRAVRGRKIGYIPQDPAVALNPVHRIGDQVAEVLRIHGLARGEAAREAALEALAQAGVPEPRLRARQYPHQLSGGTLQRVLIAIALAGSPDLVIADEPTSALDVTVQRRVLDHLEGLNRESGIAVLLITHDLAVARDRAHRVAVMSQGRVVEFGSAAQVLDDPQHPYTRRLVAAVPPWPDEAPTAGRPTAVATAPGRSGTPAPAPTPAPATDRVEPAAPALLEIRDLVKEFALPRGAAPSRVLRAVDGIDFTLARGETLALVGESGSGKSTTARLVARLERPTAGSIRFDGTDLAALDARRTRALRRRVQLVYQNPFASFDPRFTVRRIIEEPLRAFRLGDRAARRTRAAELLDLVALPSPMLDRRPAQLSGGQRQRVAIARALALQPDLLVCDEPVSALDVSVQAQILELLLRLRDELGLSYLFITHDLAVARQVCARVAVMRAGRIVETGPTDRVLTMPEHEYTRELVGAAPGRRDRARS